MSIYIYPLVIGGYKKPYEDSLIEGDREGNDIPPKKPYFRRETKYAVTQMDPPIAAPVNPLPRVARL